MKKRIVGIAIFTLMFLTLAIEMLYNGWKILTLSILVIAALPLG